MSNDREIPAVILDIYVLYNGYITEGNLITSGITRSLMRNGIFYWLFCSDEIILTQLCKAFSCKI